MQADRNIFFYAIVEGGGLPVVEEEDHGYGLSEVVELQASGANGSENAGIGNRTGGNGEFAGTEDKVSMCRRALIMLEIIPMATKTEFLPKRVPYY